MKFRYRSEEEMKDSGVEWLGKIPKEWEVKRLKYLAKIDTGDKDTQDRESEGIYPFFVRSDIVERSNTYSFDGEAILTAGDGVGVSKVFHYINGKFAYHQRVYKISEFKEMCGKYIYYYVKDNLGKEVEKISAKTTVDSLRLPMFLNFPVLVSADRGNLIANFLDEKTSQFDTIISKKEALIQTLEEAKKSLISEVVTGKVKVIKTSNGYELVVREREEMKDIGVEWLGDIPKEWDVSKVKYNTYVKGRIGWQGLKADEFIENGPYLVTGTNFNSGSVEWSKCYHISKERFEEAPEIQLKNNDLLITKDGTIGKLAIVEGCPEYAILNSGIFVTRCINNKYITKYMYYLLSSEAFKTYIELTSIGSTIQHLYQYTFVNFIYTLPSIDEQNIIVDILNRRTEKMDKLINKIILEIKKLKEAKQSLISEAVTGKIEILDEI